MPTFAVTLNDQALDVKDVKDLAGSLHDCRLIGQTTADLASALSSHPDGTLVSFAFDDAASSWDFPVAAFSLAGGGGLSLKLQQRGSLVQYHSGLANTPETLHSIDVSPGRCFLVAELSCRINGKASGKGSVGPIGISAQAATGDSYVIRNYKSFDPSITLKDAICQTVETFTFPLHADTTKYLKPGDMVLYEFDGSVNVGFGVSYGASVSVGGKSLAEITSAMKLLPAVKVGTGGLDAGFQANAGVSFAWTRRFSALIQAEPDVPGSLLLHLYTGRSSTQTIAGDLGGGISNVAAPSVSLDAGVIADHLIRATAGDHAAGLLAQAEIVDACKNAVNDFIADQTKMLSAWAAKTESHGEIRLALAFERSEALTTAFSWHLQTTNERFTDAWDCAIRGDYLAAMQTGAATLETGSGFEQVHSRQSKLDFTLFGFWNYASVEDFFRKSSVRYLGNRLFAVEATVGKQLSITSGTGSFLQSIFFKTSVTQLNGSAVSSPDVQLHGIVQVNQHPEKFIAPMLHGLSRMEHAIVFDEASAEVSALAAGATVTLHIQYSKAVLAGLSANQFAGNRQPDAPNLARDRWNWGAFSQAAADMGADLQSRILRLSTLSNDFLANYRNWERFNLAMDGMEDPFESEQATNRRSFSYKSQQALTAALHNAYNSNALSDTICRLIADYMFAGQQYMNFCADIQNALVNAQGVADWADLNAHLEKIVSKDVSSWFAAITLVAVLDSVEGCIARLGKTASSSDRTAATYSVSVAAPSEVKAYLGG